MSKREKRLQRIRQNPKNVSLEDLRQILEDHGFWLERIAGSHHIFQMEIGEQAWTVTIPFNRPVKIVYVKQALTAIDEIRTLEADGTGDEDSDG